MYGLGTNVRARLTSQHGLSKVSRKLLEGHSGASRGLLGLLVGFRSYLAANREFLRQPFRDLGGCGGSGPS